MTTATQLLRAPHIGIKKFKIHLSQRVKTHQPLVLMDRGVPKKVVIDYNEMVDMIEILGDLNDGRVWKAVKESRRAVADGEEGILAKRPSRK